MIIPALPLQIMVAGVPLEFVPQAYGASFKR